MFKKIALIFTLVILQAGLAEACPTGLRAFNKQVGGQPTCVLEEVITGELELTSSFNYILLGKVWVGFEDRDATSTELQSPIKTGKLVINPGVKIYALNKQWDRSGVWSGFTKKNGDPIENEIPILSIARDSEIIINGKASAPVLMTSAQGEVTGSERVSKAPGDWGGLIINGKARSNKCADVSDCNIRGEAGTGWYGGDDDFHNSGSMQYLQVEYGGDQLNQEKQLNGVTFNGVGLSTLIENVAVLYNADDCIEFFGGAAIAKNIFCYKGEDDGIDTTDGARVFLMRGIVVAAPYSGATEDNDRHMIEADSAKKQEVSDRLVSHPVLVNFTFVGGQNAQGFMMRRATNYTLVNSVMHGVNWCLNDDTAADIDFRNNIFADCPAGDSILNFSLNNFATAANLGLQGWVPQASSPLLAGAEYMDEFFADDFDLDDAFAEFYEEEKEAEEDQGLNTDYVGAVGSADWTGWIKNLK